MNYTTAILKKRYPLAHKNKMSASLTLSLSNFCKLKNIFTPRLLFSTLVLFLILYLVLLYGAFFLDLKTKELLTESSKLEKEVLTMELELEKKQISFPIKYSEYIQSMKRVSQVKYISKQGEEFSLKP